MAVKTLSEMSILTGIIRFHLGRLVKDNAVPHTRVNTGRGVILFDPKDVEVIREAARKAGYLKPEPAGVASAK